MTRLELLLFVLSTVNSIGLLLMAAERRWHLRNMVQICQAVTRVQAQISDLCELVEVKPARVDAIRQSVRREIDEIFEKGEG